MKKLLLILSFIPVFLLSQNTLYVGQFQPYNTIQSAINASYNGDTIFVEPGTYIENITVSKDISLISFFGPDSTVIESDSVKSSVYINLDTLTYYQDVFINPWNHGYGMMGFPDGDSLFSLYTPNVLIDGFTIKNGSGTNPLEFSSYKWGGGLLVEIGNQATINNCKIVNNNAEYGGGVALMSHAYVQFNKCIISNNHSDEGAGMRIRTRSNFKASSLTNCLVSDNTGGYYGVGIYLGGATMNINYSTIYNNGAGSIRGNGCPSNIYNINNSIIKSINGNGGGCAQYNINNSFTNGSFWSGTGNINLSSNLNFVDASNQDYRLSDSSICIGAASNDSIITDIVGNNRPNPIGSNSDIGAYENTLAFPFLPGCTDSTANNYNPNSIIDDGSCCYSAKPTGLYAYEIIDTRAKIGWDNMNDSGCTVWKYYVRYRPVGTNQWITKSAGVGNSFCNFGLNTVSKQLLNLTPSTTYEFKMKAFYCGVISSNYSIPVQFTTADLCPDMTNLTATTFNGIPDKVRFDWDTTGQYLFARIILRVDIPGTNWQTVGGFGVYYPQLFINKFGLTPGESYRAQARTFCDSNITAYRSLTWTSPIFWNQPDLIRLDGGVSINNLDVYPNPSRDLFNIFFSSDKIQDLGIRIINTVGAEVYREERKEFVGEYTKQINLDNYGKGIYFLEIETNDGVINKKLILQ